MSDRAHPFRPVGTRGVFAIIRGEDDTILLSEYRDHQHWNLPGGGVREGETDEEALIREVLDETGLLVELQEKMEGEYVRGEDTAVLYHCHVVGGRLEPTRESRRHLFATQRETGCLKIIGGPDGRMMRMIQDGFDAIGVNDPHRLFD